MEEEAAPVDTKADGNIISWGSLLVSFAILVGALIPSLIGEELLQLNSVNPSQHY